MDTATLSKAMGNVPGVDYAAYTEPFNNAMTQAGATTFLRAAHFIAQMGHESGGLRWLEEIHDGSNYEWRKDLGNTQPGWGKRYKGRGIVQLTGAWNYRRFSQWAHGKGLVNSPTFFFDNPAQVASPRWAFLVAAWYWSAERPNLNAQADADNLDAVTRSINGGTNGLADRRQRLARAKQLGDAILPTKGGSTMALFDIDMSQKFGFGGPRSTSGIRRIVIHTTENATGTPAVNVANYQINSQTGSYHYIVDSSGKRVRCNTDDWITWSTGNNAGNVQGLNLSFTTYSANTRAQWLAQEKMLRAGATVVADWCKKHNIPAVKVTTARGICGHSDMRAFGGTDHTDPGPNFPWDVFIKYVKAAMGGTTTGGDTASKGDALSAQAEKRIELILDQLAGPEKDKAGNYKFTGWPQLGNKTIVDSTVEQNKRIAALEKAVAALKGDK